MVYPKPTCIQILYIYSYISYIYIFNIHINIWCVYYIYLYTGSLRQRPFPNPLEDPQAARFGDSMLTLLLDTVLPDLAVFMRDLG